MKTLIGNKKYVVSIFVTILIVFGMCSTGFADVTPVGDRTPQVRDAIIAAAGVNSAADVTEAHLAAITRLLPHNKSIASLKVGDFDGLTSLTFLNLSYNDLSNLPAGIFEGLTSLTGLALHENDLSNLPAGIFEGLTSLTFLSLNDNDLSNLPAGIFEGLTSLTGLALYDNDLSNLPAGIFEGLTSLTFLYLHENDLSSLSAGIFEGLTSLTYLFLSDNTVDPLPLTVSLEKVSENQFKAVAPIGAPFDFVLPISVTNGSVSGGATSITIPAGSVESDILTVTRTPNTTGAVTVNIGTLPSLPSNHSGYALAKSADLPLEVISAPSNSAPVFTDGTSTTRTIAENTASGINIGTPVSATDVNNDTLTYSLSGTDAAAFSIDNNTSQLRTKSALDYETKQTYTVIVTVSDGSLTDAITITINVTDIPEVILTARFEALPESHDGSTFTFKLHFSEEIKISYRNVRDNVLNVTAGTVKAVRRLQQGSNRGWEITIEPESNAEVSIVLLPTEDCDAIGAVCTTDRRPLSSELRVIVPGPKYPSEDPETVSPISNRTPQVRDAIVAALPGVNSANDVTEAHLATITSLNLRNKGISTLNAGDFDGLTALTELQLQGNQLRTLPADVFSELSSLKMLYLGNNKLTSLSPEVFSGLTAVTDLHIHNNQLETLPQNLFSRMSSLAQINIHSNRLTSIHEDAFSGLPSLTQLFLRNNRLTSLPQDVFSGLSKLQYLYLDGNQLTSLPTDVFSGLSSLIQLLLNGNQLSTLPAEVFRGLTGLTRLRLQANSVSPMPLTVSLEKVGLNQFKATAPAGAPFAIVLPVSVANGSISGGATTLTIPQGGVESTSRTVTRTVGTTAAVTVDIGTVPGLPTRHQGYELAKSADLPLEVISAPSNSALVFTDGTSTTRTIAENTAAGINIGSPVAATDADNDSLTYSLSGTDASAFSIVSTTGQLQTSAALDYEAKNSYTVTVTAFDGSSTDTITVTINVTDANDAPTLTDGTSTSRSVAENTAAGNDIGTPVAATDPDNDTLEYSLGGTDASSFDINSTNGQLRTSASLNYESRSSYSVTISVSDGNGGSDSITVTINVTDANDAPTLTDGTSTSRSVAENTAAGNNIGTAVAATDADDDTLTWTLGGTDAASFTFDSTTRRLLTQAALDYETKTSYTVVVTVSDGTLTDTITITINVTNVNEAPAFKHSSDTRSIPENTAANTSIGNALDVSEPDGDSLTYSLGGADAASFTFDSTTRRLLTQVALDYETKTSYTVVVTVSDGTLTDTITITINVTNVNEAPVFSDGSSTSRSIAENTASGQNIGSAVSATDPDSGTTLTYTLGGTDAASFGINSTNGQLRTSASLNYESRSSYSVTISVSNGNGGSDSISVTINVTNVNEAPAFKHSSDTRSIPENTAANTSIGNALDVSEPDGDSLTYSLGGADAASFTFDSTTRRLLTQAALDYETKTSYTVVVTVSDGTLTDTITITINVTNVNEAPAFKHSSDTRSIPENTAANTSIGNALDVSEPDGDSLTYSLGGADAASFTFDSTTRRLLTQVALDYETKTSYTVVVTVSDGTLTDTITITINVTNVNEAPAFSDGSSTSRSIAENTASGQNIGSAVSATDPDSGTTLTYTLGGTDAASFGIVSSSGQLQTKAALDYETKTSYSVTVSVSDGNGGTDSITVTINVTDVPDTPDPPLSERTRQVRDAIVAAVPGVSSADDVTAAHLAAIKALDIRGSGISSLQAGDFNGLTALTDLDLRNNSLSDISALENLTSLTYLTLRDNSLSDISALENLTSLTGLNLGNNTSLSDISALEHLTNLTLLYLYNTSLSDISVLEHLTNLRTLYLDDTSLSNISVLEHLTNLRTLNLGNNTSLSDISVLENLTNLRNLDLRDTSLSNISALESLTNLTSLYLSGNTISDYGPLRRLIAAIEAAGRSLRLDITIPLDPPLSERTRQVRDAIVAAVPGVSSADDVTDAHLAAIKALDIGGSGISSLQAGDFNGLTTLTLLDLRNNSLSDISALENLTNLTYLNLWNNSLSDISALENLTSLTELNLGYNTSLSDISALENLTSLTELNLGNNTSLSDISALENLTSLTGLNLGKNTSLSDISALENLTSLTSLNLGNNTSLSDISALEHLTNLTLLYLHNTSLSDISVLEHLTNLTSLYLSNTSLSDISVLEHLTNLRTLNLSDTSLSNISVLEHLTNLRTLNLSDTSISDISALESLTNLTSLSLSGNTISDYGPLLRLTAAIAAAGRSLRLDITIPIDPPLSERTRQVRDAIVRAVPGISSADDVTATHLAAIASLSLRNKRITTLQTGDFDGLTSLTTLDLSSNSISDISPLQNLTNLTDLYLPSNSISDISTLQNLTNLTDLYLWTNSISDISTLQNLTNLTSLYLSSNSISDISTLQNLTNLTDLYLSSNSISDISTLQNLTNLTSLYLRKNSISDISTLQNLTNLRTLSLSGNSISDYAPLRRLIAAIEAAGGSLTLDITIPEEDDNRAPSTQATPIQTELLPNFPNPFNPETWIPYHLAKASDVQITIYNARGVVVRELSLGHQVAGYYTSKNRAAYWDGKNEFGEKVAAGVYFYQLQADSVSFLRKMVILK